MKFRKNKNHPVFFFVFPRISLSVIRYFVMFRLYCNVIECVMLQAYHVQSHFKTVAYILWMRAIFRASFVCGCEWVLYRKLYVNRFCFQFYPQFTTHSIAGSYPPPTHNDYDFCLNLFYFNNTLNLLLYLDIRDNNCCWLLSLFIA